MKASETTFRKLTERIVQYLVPLFQRPYSWNRDNWKMLLTDLTDLCETESPNTHFIGSIVVAEIFVRPKSLTNYYLLIDGQQRLTTLFILLILLRDIAINESKILNLPEQIEQLIVNRFLVDLEYFKLLPTQQDRETFVSLVNRGASELHTKNLILDCYNFFKRGTRNLDRDKLYEVVCDKLAIVEIVLEGNDNPYVVFANLNATGMELTESDLIRNYFFMRIEQGRQQEVYEEYWLPMQKLLGDDLSEFMRHYLSSDGKVIKKNEIYFELKRKVDVYSDVAVLDELRRIKEFSLLFEKLKNPEKEHNSFLRSKLIRIKSIMYDSVHSFLLRCYDDYENSRLTVNDFVDILQVLETFTIRRFVCKDQTRGLNKTFPLLYQKAQTTITSSTSLVERVKISLEGACPKDTKFREAIIGTSLTEKAEKSPIKSILETIEQYLSNSADIPASKVEYVMPKSINADWRKDLGENYQQCHELHLYKLGNLTLVPSDYELSGRSFAEKKQYFNQSNLTLNSWFKETEQWNDVGIERRTKDLAEAALQIWSYFGSSVQTSGDGITGTTPITLEILGDRFPVRQWNELYVALLNWSIAYDSDAFLQLSRERFISKSNHGMRSPVALNNGYYAETHGNAKSIYRFCTQVMDHLELSSEDWNVERE